MKKKTLIFDLDGTMYRGTELIPGGLAAVEFCQKHDIPFLFMTNNAMRTQQENVEHMEAMGYRNLKPEQFFNSAMASALYVQKQEAQKRVSQQKASQEKVSEENTSQQQASKEKTSADKGSEEGHELERKEPIKAWYIGEKGLQEALEQNGFVISEDHPDYVFVGLDKQADYARYSKALSMLLDGAKLIGTNKDRILAKPGGFEVGNGSVVALFEYATNTKSPDIGKPARPILDLCLDYYGLKPEDVILVGDNLETDIALGYNNQVETVFVQTGIHHAEDIERLKVIPDHIVRDLRDLDLITLTTH